MFSLARNAISTPFGARGMATLKDLKLRISSTKNIQKITKSMKMIASTRLIKAQKNMEAARVYGVSSDSFFDHAETQSRETPEKPLRVAVTSDKGLCGGVHSAVSRTIRKEVYQNSNIQIICIGDKSKAQLSRLFPRNIVLSFSGLGSKIPSFDEACLIGSMILEKSNDQISLVYNKFKSAIAYDTTVAPLHTFETLSESPKMDVYEIEDDVLKSFQEFSFANKVYHAMAEGYASEVAAKMTAMDNATRNAGDLIGKLTIVYNRTRQAVITTELVDIITGASAL